MNNYRVYTLEGIYQVIAANKNEAFDLIKYETQLILRVVKLTRGIK